jgi:peptide/nickel transport system substrate-binding protein
MTRRVRTVAIRSLGALAISLLTFGPSSWPGGQARAAASTFTIGWAGATTNLDPTATGDNPNIWVEVNIYDQLVRIGTDGTSLHPDLATSWDITGGGKVYTFHLRRGVTFTNGQPLTSADVKFALDRARAPKAVWSWTLTAIKNVTTPDASTVRVTLKNPWSPFLSDVALYDTGVYPMSYYKKVGADGLGKHPVGTGPYMLESWLSGQSVTLVKNSRYWAAGQFPLQRVEYQTIPNDNTRLLKAESGALDVDNAIAPNLIGQAQRNRAVHVRIDHSTLVKYVKGNAKLPQFQDIHVREAIDHAINRQALVKALLFGYGSPANSFIPKGALDWNPTIPVPSYDVSLAKKLMSESKYPHGFTMPYEVQSGDAEYGAIAQIIQSELKAIGINMQIRPTDPTSLTSTEQSGRYHFMATLWTNDIPDPDELTEFAVDSSASSAAFFTWYKNAQLTTLTHRAERTANQATRKELYYRIQSIWAQQTPFYALYNEPFVNVVNAKVSGFKENPLGYLVLQGVHKG